MIGDMETEFKRWRERCALTQAQAAEQLGLSRSRVVELDTGKSRRGPTKSKEVGSTDLDRRTRLAMAAIMQELEPYHEDVN